MAQRRMFSQRIISSAKFLKLPSESQALYFHLCMRADDDGIVEAYTVLRLVGVPEDNFKVLVSRNFVRPLNEDLVSYILDWNEHNLIRADRKINSIYKELLVQVLPEVDLIEPKPRADRGNINSGIKGRPQKRDDNGTEKGRHRLGKVRLGKVRLEREDTPSEKARKFFDNPEQVISLLLERGLNEQVTRQEVTKFASYWTEPNKSGTKVRWELQPTFDVMRRLATWLNKSSQFNQSKPRGAAVSE